MRGSKGFTLAELLIVVAIAGGLAGMAAYSIRYSGANSFSIQKATMLDTLTAARNMAHVRGECVVVAIAPITFVVTTSSYTADSARTCAGPFSGLPNKTLPSVKFGAQGVTLGPLNSGATSIVFNTLGGLANDNVLTFSMTDGKDSANVRIYPAIGQIRVR